MNFSFYIHGTPNGYNQYPFDNNSVSLQEFAQSNTTESQLTVFRKGQLVYYAYMRRLQEKSSTFLGFCLVFNGVYCRNPKKLYDLFDRVFYDVQLKGEFLKFDKGKSVYIVGKFTEKLLEIERIKMFFKNNLEDDFTRDFTSISPAFKFGNGKKNISIKENSIDILTAIAEFEVVHIANNEKSLSELERTQKLLTDLYVEKQTLQQNYNKLLAKKRQYSVVILLCFILIGCAAGLFTFNRNLQSKDSQIGNLNKEVKQKQDNIETLNQNITQLQVRQKTLENENINLTNKVSQLFENNKELKATNEQLDSENSTLNYTIHNLESKNDSYRIDNNILRIDNNALKTNNQRLSSDIEGYKKYVPQTYKTRYANQYLYNKCGGKYEKADCYFASSGAVVYIYKQEDSYGLTNLGSWIPMYCLEKY